MNRFALLLLAGCALLALAPLAGEESEVTLRSGVYHSDYQDSPRRLRAEFTLTGEGRWDVVFHFTHGGQRLSYAGSAEGSLTDGELSGEVRSRNGRVFVFRGEVSEGKFQGRHAEVGRRGRETDTGPLQFE